MIATRAPGVAGREGNPRTGCIGPQLSEFEAGRHRQTALPCNKAGAGLPIESITFSA